MARDTLQITFGRRIVGHKFGSVMNYRLPAHVCTEDDPHHERFGFLAGGAYS